MGISCESARWWPTHVRRIHVLYLFDHVFPLIVRVQKWRLTPNTFVCRIDGKIVFVVAAFEPPLHPSSVKVDVVDPVRELNSCVAIVKCVHHRDENARMFVRELLWCQHRVGVFTTPAIRCEPDNHMPIFLITETFLDKGYEAVDRHDCGRCAARYIWILFIFVYKK